MFNIFSREKRPEKAPPAKRKVWPVLSTQQIAIRKLSSVLANEVEFNNVEELSRIQLEAMKLGFIFSEKATKVLARNQEIEVEVFKVLQSLVGANKAWRPFYPNFPKQVRNAHTVELFFNSVAHYWTDGQWKPQYQKESRLPLYEDVQFKEIGLSSKSDLLTVFNNLLSSNGSLAEKDNEIIYSLLNHFEEVDLLKHIPETIPFKETMCQLVAFALELGYKEIANIELSNTTDLLRIATGLSGGDVSLAENTRFKLKRRYRKWLVKNLELAISENDVKRHSNKWKRLFHCLHIGTYADAPKSQAIANKLRNEKLIGTNTVVEEALLKKDDSKILGKLLNKPGEFARRLDHLLRIFPIDKAIEIFDSFESVVGEVDTRVLIQMLGHFRHRVVNQSGNAVHGTTEASHTRVALPKGQIANVKVLKNQLKDIEPKLLISVVSLIENTLKSRFRELPPLGKVWIDPELKKCPVPIQMRSAAEGLKIIQRGTRLPMGNKNTLRFFVHWVGKDIDLSAAFLTEELKFHSEIAYYELTRGSKDGYKAVHSGDITDAPAPEGACEFIDINLDSIDTSKIRYIAMDVRVYEGLPFPLQDANVGWMMRDELGEAGEIFDARTVEQRISVSATSHSCMVAIFDVKMREVVWLDLIGSSNYLRGGNNVASNRFNIEDLLEASLNFHQVSMYDLLKIHVDARGEQVSDDNGVTTRFDREMIYSYESILANYL